MVGRGAGGEAAVNQVQREKSRQENGKEQTCFQDLKQIFGCPGCVVAGVEVGLSRCQKLFVPLAFDSAPCSVPLCCVCWLSEKKENVQCEMNHKEL